MLTEDQASIIHGLAARALAFDATGLVTGAPPGFELDQVVDALASLEAAKVGSGGRAIVLEYLGRLAPDLRAGAIDSAGTPSCVRLARHEQRVGDLIRSLGGEVQALPHRRWTARRGGVELDLPAWLPIEVLDSLAQIGEALAVPGTESAWSAPSMAYEAERQAGEGRRGRAVLEEVGRLLRLIDPSLDEVTATSVELAVRAVRSLRGSLACVPDPRRAPGLGRGHYCSHEENDGFRSYRYEEGVCRVLPEADPPPQPESRELTEARALAEEYRTASASSDRLPWEPDTEEAEPGPPARIPRGHGVAGLIEQAAAAPEPAAHELPEGWELRDGGAVWPRGCQTVFYDREGSLSIMSQGSDTASIDAAVVRALVLASDEVTSEGAAPPPPKRAPKLPSVVREILDWSPSSDRLTIMPVVGTDTQRELRSWVDSLMFGDSE